MTLTARGLATVTLALATSAVHAPDVSAQASPLVLELRGGVSAPVGSFDTGDGGDGGLDAGPSLGVDITLSGAGRRSTYVGFSQHRFGCSAVGCAAGGRYVATGFDVGFRFSLRTRGSVIPWLRVGALTTRVETRDLGSDAGGVSDLAFGGEVGLGVYVGASSAVAFNPGVRFAGVDTRLPTGEILRMRYLVADLAIALSF